MTRNVQTEIKEVIDANAVILFMKGNREMPQCGFSARSSRSSTTATSSTPRSISYATPRCGRVSRCLVTGRRCRLYIQGEFVGGCDIVTDMHLSGQLETMLGPVKS